VLGIEIAGINLPFDLLKLLQKICQDLKKFNQGKNFKDEVSMVALRIEKEKNR
jgi:hypothetical protein